jgi:hypothetical protein
MPWADALIDWIHDALALNGVDADRDLIVSLFWLAAGGIALYYGYQALGKLVDAGIGAGRFVKEQVDGKFWRDPGKLRFLIGLVLLVVAYGFYGTDQSRPLGEALLDIGRGQLLAVMPLAITTQWILLIACWLLLGLVMGVPFAKLGKPIADTVLGLAVIGVQLLICALAFLAFGNGRNEEGAAWSAVFAATVLVLVLLMMLPNSQAAKAGKRPSPAKALGFLWPLLTVLIAVCYLIVLGIVLAVLHFGGGDPDDAAIIRGVLVAVLVLALIMGFRFRNDILGEAEAPEALLYFIDFSLALAAGVVAVFGAQQSPVTLGPVPAWVIALGPPLIIAGMIFTVRLRRLRETTPRWTACLLTGIGAAFLVLPATLGLTRLLNPVLPTVDLPFL